MSFFKSLNKEQWTALVASAICALMLLFGLSGGIAPGPETVAGATEEPYEPFKPRHLEFPDEKFERYWQGKDIFKTESVAKLPVPQFKAPEPREEELPAPPFRPGPAWEIYNKLPVPMKYLTLTPGAPLVAEANLPTPAEIDELCKMEEPVVAPRPDKRGEKERDTGFILLKSGVKWEALDPEIVADLVIYKDPKSGQKRRVPRAEVKEIGTNLSFEKLIQQETEKIKPGPKEPEERFKLAQRCVELGMIPEAKAELKKVLEVRRDDLEAVLLLGQLSVEGGDYDTALATYRGGLEAGASAGELWYEIGRCLKALGVVEGALSAFEKSVEASPRLHRARLALVRAQLDAGQPAAAEASANDFFTKLGNAPDTLPAQRGEAHLVRALALLRLGQLDKARTDLAEALKIEPQNGEALNAGGAALALEGKFPNAGPEFVKAIRAGQYVTDAWTNLGALLLLGARWADAEKIFDAAAQRDAASVDAVLGKGLAQMMAGKKEAPGLVDKAAQMEPRDLQVLQVSGLLLLRAGQDEEALGKFVAALRQDFYFLPAYSGAAAAYLRTARKLAASRDDASQAKAGELRVNAETLLRAIRNFDPNRASAWAALGCAYAVMQRPADARLALRQAMALAQDKKEPLIFYTLGYIECYYGEGATEEERMDSARREFEQAIKIEAAPTDGFAQRVIADCKDAISHIDAWKKTQIRLIQEFNGPEARNIGDGWLQAQAYGIGISREQSKEKGGRAKFSGKQILQDWGMTSLLHDLAGDEFHSFEITLFPEKVEKTEYGISIYYAHQGQDRSGLQVGVDTAGKVRYSLMTTDRDMDRHDMSVGWVEVKKPLPNPKEVRLKITQGELNRVRFFTLWFWDEAKGDWMEAQAKIPVNASARGAWRVGAWVRAWKDQEVLLYVDNIRVLDQSRR